MKDVVSALVSSLTFNRLVVFVSSPITTGYSFMKGYPSAEDEQRARAMILGAKIRHRMPDAVLVEPARLMPIPGFSRENYTELWRAVMTGAKHINVVFANKWQYSDGCVDEMRFAKQNEFRCYDEDLNTITLPNALTMVEFADKIIKAHGRETSRERAINAQLLREMTVAECE